MTTETEHVCNLRDAWPTGHPLPPEDPAKLQGPEVGEFMVLKGRSFGSRSCNCRRDAELGEGATCLSCGHRDHGSACRVMVPLPKTPDVLVRVIRRSYVWSPGECRARGGYRHYDWSVVEEGPNEYRSVVVNDTDLSPLPTVSHWGGPEQPMRVHTVYTLQDRVPALAEVVTE